MASTDIMGQEMALGMFDSRFGEFPHLDEIYEICTDFRLADASNEWYSISYAWLYLLLKITHLFLYK